MESELLTIGDVARELGVPKTRIAYALDKAVIREKTRAGILRIFGRDQLPSIRAALGAVRSRASRRQMTS